MMHRLAAVTFAVWIAAAGAARAQSLDEVSKAVHDYFGEDDVKVPAHALLGAWGEAALPHLRTLGVAQTRLSPAGVAALKRLIARGIEVVR